MPHPDPQLVKQIADAVMAALRGGGATRLPERAHIQPAVGICTGDYGQFTDRPDLTGRGGVRPEPTPAASSGKPTPELTIAPSPAAPGLTGIITAGQLEEAVEASADGVATLAATARLTPLAQDYVRDHPAKVRRAEASNAPAPVSSSAVGQPMLYWIDGHCPGVRDLAARLGNRLTLTHASAKGDEITRIVRDIAAALKSSRAAGAVLFVRSAALPLIAANRCPSLRAVMGSSGSSVDAACAETAANVLVIEYPFVTPGTMNAMVDRFLQQSMIPTPTLQRELAELHRSGQ